MQTQGVEQIRAIIKSLVINQHLERLPINMAFRARTNLQLIQIRNEYFEELVMQ